MSMISYAQNREDVLLARAFPGPIGFYVDVGAADPIGHSVTKCFYERGWSGINIEPLPTFFARVEADRPRDINLNAVVSNSPGESTLWEHPGSIGMSTVEAQVATYLKGSGAALIPHLLPRVTLRDVWAEHVRGRTVDFLKIDVEGHERAVLDGADFERDRPRVLVIEATEPGRPDPNHHLWESVVLEADYHFATFDGLNRYYVRGEDRDLLPHFATPPNVFDDYVLAEMVEMVSTRKRLESAASELNALRDQNARLRQAFEASKLILDQTRRHLEQSRNHMFRSNS